MPNEDQQTHKLPCILMEVVKLQNGFAVWLSVKTGRFEGEGPWYNEAPSIAEANALARALARERGIADDAIERRLMGPAGNYLEW
jgi:hypothetical protein